MRKILETTHIKLNYSESLEALVQATIPLLEQKIEEYKLFFGISDIKQIIVNYFDNIEEFREFIYSLRGEKDSLPAYARGTYDRGMINSCVKPESQ